MATIEMHANRNLRPRTLSRGTKRGVDNFISFTHNIKTRWWTKDIPFSNDAFAVYENSPGSREDALVFTEHQLIILGGNEPTVVHFNEIVDLPLPAKEPLRPWLEVVLHPSRTVRIPTNPPEFAFDLYRFLLSALTEVKRHKNTS